MATQRDRSLEVIVLAGRGLSNTLPAGSRRKVQICLVSARDPLGEAFGAKVSPWTAAGQVPGQPQNRAIRFGTSGLKCSFPLSGRRGAPSITADPRFPETAEVRVRLLASQVSTNNSVTRTAAAFLPTAVMDFASQEVDEATAQIEAEMKVPLTNILSGRVGHAADRALGGWVPLRNCLDEIDAPLQSKDEIPPALWMQMYVLPDHESLIPKLHAQLNQILGLEKPQLPKQHIGPHHKAKPAEQSNAASGFGATGGPARATAAPGPALASAAPRWGPASAGKSAPQQVQSQVVDDLIDVTLGDSPSIHAHDQPVNLLDDLDGLIPLDDFDSLIPSSSSGGGQPAQGLGQDSLHDLRVASGLLPTMGQDLPHLGGAKTSSAGLPVASGFGFVHGGSQGYAASQPVMQSSPFPAAAPTTTSSGSSAFGFIAGNSEVSKLDLAALYATSEPPKAQAASSDFSALASIDLQPELARPKAAGPAGGSLESLEQSILADLKF